MGVGGGVGLGVGLGVGGGVGLGVGAAPVVEPEEMIPKIKINIT